MALVLTANMGDKFYIGDDITVIVDRQNYNQVKLIFDAPKHISIDREKIRIKKIENGEL